MSNAKNYMYEIKPKIKEFIERDYQKLKKFEESKSRRKYFKREYFEEVGEYCGVTGDTIQQVHRKNLSVSYIVAIKLSEWLKVDVQELFPIVKREET